MMRCEACNNCGCELCNPKEYNKFILDITCGARGIWFEKKNPFAIYGDIRKEVKGFVAERTNYEVNPDILLDFKDLPYDNETFKMIIFDPPHLKNISPNSWIGKKYGSLDDNWRENLKKAFEECYRVLENYGVLIFKWSTTIDGRKNRDIPINEVLKLVPKELMRIVGHTSGSKSNTLWASFMKIPKGKIEE